MKKDLEHPIEKVGAKLRARMPWLEEGVGHVSRRVEHALPFGMQRGVTAPLRQTNRYDHPRPNRVLIFDTTLRDGEQSPGCSMTQPEKLRVAQSAGGAGGGYDRSRFPGRLAGRLGIRAMPSPARFTARLIAGLARCHRDDINTAWGALSKTLPTPSPPRVPGHQRHPSPVQAEHGEGRNHPHRRRRREDGARPVRRRGVLARGRVAHRARVSGRGGGSRRSRPVPPRSMSRTRWATPCRKSSTRCSAT